MRLALWGVIALALGGCLASDANTCDNGRICPVNTICDLAHDGCVVQPQIDACVGLGDGDMCTYGSNTGRCDADICMPYRCGDGIVLGSEDCEPGLAFDDDSCLDHGFYDDGVVTCTSSCQFDTSACTRECDDGTLDPEEQCDLDDLAGVDDCTDLGFQDEGDVACTPNCRYDTSACTGFCGDGLRGGAEECEGTDLGGVQTCQDLGYYDGGAVTCGDGCLIDRSTCARRCGDDVLDAEEQCDGDLLGDHETCGAFGFYVLDTPVTCSGSCRWDLDACTGECGDAVLNGPEDCEPVLSFPEDCTDLGYYDPVPLGCLENCAFDTSACTGECGDRTVNGGEVCDGRSATGDTCGKFGYDDGYLSCLGACTADISSCVNWNEWEILAIPTDDFFYAWEVGGAGYDVYIVGEAYPEGVSYGGRIYRRDASGWLAVLDIEDEAFQAVWANDTNDVIAVADGGGIYRFDGDAWAPMTSGTTQSLMDVWGRASDDIFVVGSQGTIRHWDGDSWDAEASGTTQLLMAVFGFPTGEVFAVGQNVVLRRDGGTWSTVSTTGGTHRGLWGAAADDVWISTQTGTLRHYDGLTLTTVSSGVTSSIEGIWGFASNDVYATTSTGTILHYEGAIWELETTSEASLRYGIWGASPSDIWSVGGDGGEALHYRHARWRPRTGPSSNTLTRVLAFASDDVYVRHATGTHHWDGDAWTPIGGITVEAMFGRDANEVYLVGFGGAVQRWDGAAWQVYPAPANVTISSIWASGPDDVFVYAAGATPTIWHHDGDAWSVSTTTTGFTHLWGFGPTEVYLSDPAGVRRYDGNTWTAMPGSPTGGELWGTSGTDLFARSTTALVRYDGRSWTPVPGAPGLVGFAGVSGHALFGSSQAGLLTHYDGLRWSVVDPFTSLFLADVSATRDIQAVVGELGILRLREPACQDREVSCDDGLDEDCDGAYDCADTECAADAYCINGGACSEPLGLGCDMTIEGRNTALADRSIDQYACDTWDRIGRDEMFRFVVPAGVTEVTLDLTTPADDLDLVVLREQGTWCEPRLGGCVGATALGADTLTFDVAENDVYYVIVDSVRDAGLYTLTATCD